ncbi:hypothetical protein QBC46DRAFT_341703 [Diplogelasinospora grovesii]|uniref:Uncharacterized protein n=1 Tax=Diplogelasinospora grovesii TaxID=303347 RepID=A0AAN6N9N2_9PEZI|nr:hypothetical protein QBC46DRAFT_341703 [Diplogelasinospora grovesii]
MAPVPIPAGMMDLPVVTLPATVFPEQFMIAVPTHEASKLVAVQTANETLFTEWVTNGFCGLDISFREQFDYVCPEQSARLEFSSSFWEGVWSLLKDFFVAVVLLIFVMAAVEGIKAAELYIRDREETKKASAAAAPASPDTPQEAAEQEVAEVYDAYYVQDSQQETHGWDHGSDARTEEGKEGAYTSISDAETKAEASSSSSENGAPPGKKIMRSTVLHPLMARGTNPNL